MVMSENVKEFLKLEEKDFYSMHTPVLILVNKVCDELGIDKSKRCIDCLRRKWFEISEILNDSGGE